MTDLRRRSGLSSSPAGGNGQTRRVRRAANLFAAGFRLPDSFYIARQRRPGRRAEATAMRDDMFEVIIERPRWASRARYPRSLRRREAHATKHNPESLGFVASVRYGDKWLNDNVAPLRRYLERQVNRPWDKVWSEICAKLRTASAVQQHVRDHVADFVALKTFMRDGVVWDAQYGRFLGSAPLPLAQSRSALYVDPRSGLLRRNKHADGQTYKTGKRQREREARERAKRMREIAPNLQAHRFGERGWWEVVLAPTELSSHEIQRQRLDVVVATGFSDLPPHLLYGRRGVYAIAKRQLSKREIAQLMQ